MTEDLPNMLVKDGKHSDCTSYQRSTTSKNQVLAQETMAPKPDHTDWSTDTPAPLGAELHAAEMVPVSLTSTMPDTEKIATTGSTDSRLREVEMLTSPHA